MSLGKIGYKGKPYYDEYVINPPNNGDHPVLSSYTSSHVSSVHDFGSITPLFFDHMPNIGVMENNRITLLKSRMKDTQELV
jgi:hypothetical protein